MVMIFETSIQVYAANGENLQELAPLEISNGKILFSLTLLHN